MRRAVTCVIPLGLAALFLAFVPSGHGSHSAAPAAVHTAKGQAVVLTQRVGASERFELTVSDSGTSAVEYRGKAPFAGAIVRYEDRALFVLNYAKKTYSEETIAQAVIKVARDRKLMLKAHAEIKFKTPSGRPPFTAPVLTETDLKTTIADHSAQAYLLKQNGAVDRLWLALDLPEAPPEIQKQVSHVVDMGTQAGRVVLRAEVQVNGKWRTSLETIASKTVDGGQPFAPPSGWTRRSLTQQRTPATIPGVISRGSGPISSKPDVFAIYWGSGIPGTFITTMNSFLSSAVAGPTPNPYWGGLAQYGVSRGAFIGSSPIVAFPLLPDVGCYNVPWVWHMLEFAYFNTRAPKIWWNGGLLGARDPVIAISISSADVAACTWTGYHMFAPSPAWLIPFPTSLAAHPMMPFLIAKATSSSSTSTILSVGASTEDMTHELVEVVTDPIPLSANVDSRPSHSPQFVDGEIADICSFNTPRSTAVTVEFGFTVSKYWSTAAKTCVG